MRCAADCGLTPAQGVAQGVALAEGPCSPRPLPSLALQASRRLGVSSRVLPPALAPAPASLLRRAPTLCQAARAAPARAPARPLFRPSLRSVHRGAFQHSSTGQHLVSECAPALHKGFALHACPCVTPRCGCRPARTCSWRPAAAPLTILPPPPPPPLPGQRRHRGRCAGAAQHAQRGAGRRQEGGALSPRHHPDSNSGGRHGGGARLNSCPDALAAAAGDSGSRARQAEPRRRCRLEARQAADGSGLDHTPFFPLSFPLSSPNARRVVPFHTGGLSFHSLCAL